MSLSKKLSIYVILATVVIFCAIGAVFFRYGQQREERLVKMYGELMVENSVIKVNQEFYMVAELLKDNAPVVSGLLERPDAIKGFVEHLVREDSLVMGGCVAVRPGYLPPESEEIAMEYVYRTPDGVWRSKHLGEISDGYDYTVKSWFTDALKSDGAVWSEPYFDKGAGDEMMVTCSYPVRDAAGEAVAVLTADVSLGTIVSEISRLRPVDDSYSFILGRDGVFVAHPDSSLVLRRTITDYAESLGCSHVAEIGRRMMERNRGAVHTDIAGEDVLAVYGPVGGTGWSICVVTPYASIMSRLDLVTVKAVILLLVGLLALAVIVHLIITYSMKPLSSLTAAAAQISGGDLDARLPVMKVSDEIGRLNNAFSEMQLSLKRQMAELVTTTKAKERIESELHIARSIQLGLIPHVFSPFPEWEGLELYAMLRSAKEVGGDLYDFFIRDSKLFFAIGDVSGKGVPASLFMAVTRTLFRMTAAECDSPARILRSINDTVVKDNEACMFVTMFVGVLDLGSGRLAYSNAGHNPPVIVSPDGVSFLKVEENIPLGVMGGFDYAEEQVTLRGDDKLFLYTDGLTEAENASKQLFGDDRMLASLSDAPDSTPKESIEHVLADVERFAGDVEQSDDLTMLCLRLNNQDDSENTVYREFRTSLEIVGELPAFTEEVSKKFSLSAETAGRLNLMLEELLVNVVSYAYPSEKAGDEKIGGEKVGGERASERIIVTVSFAKDGGSENEGGFGVLAVDIEDGGRPFDPTVSSAPDTDAPLDSRPIGGLGIHLVKSLAASMDYRREQNRNHLRFTLRDMP